MPPLHQSLPPLPAFPQEPFLHLEPFSQAPVGQPPEQLWQELLFFLQAAHPVQLEFPPLSFLIQDVLTEVRPD